MSQINFRQFDLFLWIPKYHNQNLKSFTCKSVSIFSNLYEPKILLLLDPSLEPRFVKLFIQIILFRFKMAFNFSSEITITILQSLRSERKSFNDAKLNGKNYSIVATWFASQSHSTQIHRTFKIHWWNTFRGFVYRVYLGYRDHEFREIWEIWLVIRDWNLVHFGQIKKDLWIQPRLQGALSLKQRGR